MQLRDPAEGSPSMHEAGIVQAGTILDGRFKVERLIGQGGMGYVLAAMHLELQQRVALKLLSPNRDQGQEPQGQEPQDHQLQDRQLQDYQRSREQKERSALRLSREARASARIRSEHVVRVLDVVHSQGDLPYIVLEYLEGEDLAHRLGRCGRLELTEAVEIVLQACEAVGEGHRLGIVHRDLKPSNLFLCSRGGHGVSVKVLDFGISKMDEAGASLTQSHALLGSPVYAAPEQLRSSHEVDARADIWSLGIVLYECVTGARPFEGQTLAQVCTSILYDSPRSPRALNPQLPAALEAVLLRCLRREPAQRYQSIEELVRALHHFAPRAAERCASYLDTLPPAEPGRISHIPARVTARGGPSDTLTGSAEYDSHDGTASLVRAGSDPRGRAKWSVLFAGVAIAAIVAWQLLRSFERAAPIDLTAHSASEPQPNALPSAAELPKPSAVASALRDESLSPRVMPTAAIPTTSSKPAEASPSGTAQRGKSSRTAGPQPPRPTTHPAIAPWVDTR